MQTQHLAPVRDNLLGVCHAVGTLFGFDPLYLRLALLVAVMINAEVAIVVYATLGVAVAAASLLTWRSARRSGGHRLAAA